MKTTLRLMLLTLALAAPAWAGEDIGQFCWNFGGGLADRLRLSVTHANGHSNPATSATMFNVNAQWRGPGAYQLLGAGTITESHPTDGLFHGGLSLSNPTSFFSANRVCAMHISLNPADLGGTWMITCVGAAAPFTNSGSLTFDPACAGPPDPAARALTQNFGYTSTLAGEAR